MKQLFRGLAMAVVGLTFTAGSALAVHMEFAYNGDYIMSDENLSGAAETINFSNVKIVTTEPDGDSIFGASINIAPLTLDEAILYQFDPMDYIDGFEVVGFFTADLRVEEIIPAIGGNSGTINPFLALNLTNIEADGAYAGGSALADAFIKYGVGSTSMSANAKDIFTVILTPGFDSSFTGSAQPIPEPATMLLFGSGLASLVGMARRRKGQA